MLKKIGLTLLLAVAGSAAMAADEDGRGQRCLLSSQTLQYIQSKLAFAVQDGNGGFFTPNEMWSAIVDRQGTLCSVVQTADGDAWPGSRAIAIAKAETANDFSNSKLALSTANLYAATQPGGSLYGLNNSNPFNPDFNRITTDGGPGTGLGRNPGGIITFGGGVALYSGGKVIGGLGVSGDSSCADHAIAYRMRRAAHLDSIPGGAGLNGTDNIVYTPNGQVPSGFEQPHCTTHDITP